MKATITSEFGGCTNIDVTDEREDLLKESYDALRELRDRMRRVSYLLNGNCPPESLAKAYNESYPDRYRSLIKRLKEQIFDK